MAQILTTKGLAAGLERIIQKAESEIYLISYSFKIEDSYIKRIKLSAERGVKVKVVYGESLKDETKRALTHLPNTEIRQYPGLHAKVFSNTSECIIGSMNFYDYSELHNTELGCLITAKDDAEAFNEALQHCKEIFSWAQPNEKEAGYCIRTGVQIPFNLEKPYSRDAYKEWNKYGNEDYPEKYCHFSGEPSHGETSYSKPILKKYWKKAQEAHRL